MSKGSTARANTGGSGAPERMRNPLKMNIDESELARAALLANVSLADLINSLEERPYGDSSRLIAGRWGPTLPASIAAHERIMTSNEEGPVTKACAKTDVLALVDY